MHDAEWMTLCVAEDFSYVSVVLITSQSRWYKAYFLSIYIVSHILILRYLEVSGTRTEKNTFLSLFASDHERGRRAAEETRLVDVR